MVEPDNMVLVLLREMRQEFREGIAGLRDEIAEARAEARAADAAILKRLDAMHLNGMKALKGFIGHRTMVERTMAHFDDQVSRLEQRVAALEAVRP